MIIWRLRSVHEKCYLDIYSNSIYIKNLCVKIFGLFEIKIVQFLSGNLDVTCFHIYNFFSDFSEKEMLRKFHTIIEI